ncbi:type I-E CRISPR-associated protein Cas5/CasD [Arenibaculum sp.]|jgi:CRISPR system Cascade subunit CasD|uniref:type I-E CRISPR-associated protein Cas5/CasD n=1 Tax=Arenibaculum sp. TaxID=2865862 RepID=UPI002E152D68|nr:type I-E CRISPR-associated protein Cas5/CasD [Arenibaculum sp.]
MRRFLHLHFDAPMMSFGGIRIDALPDAYPVPTASMVAGLIANAFGVLRAQTDLLQRLQDAIAVASGVVRHGTRVVDFQTADLGKPHMRGPMWTRSGPPFARAGQGVAEKRQLQWRPYVADADVHTVVWCVGDPPWTLEQMAERIAEPARPLFIGRANCPPVRPLCPGIVEAETAEAALRAAAGDRLRELHLPLDEAGMEPEDRLVSVHGRRLWDLNVHAGADPVVVRTVRAA